MPDETNARTEWAEMEQDKVVNDTQKVSDRDIEIGDVVCLNSGGPGMTVMEIHEDGMAACRRWAAMSQMYVNEVLPLKVIRRKEPQNS